MTTARLAEIRAAAEKHAGKGSKCVEMLLECVAALEKRKERRAKPSAPTMAEVLEHADVIGLSESEAEKFFDHHEARGWILGRNIAMKDYRAALRTWKRHVTEFSAAPVKKGGFGVG